jgi:protein gp37
MMTIIGTGISWTNSSWNLSVGCDKVSAGCDHCYAEELVNRLPTFKHRFDEVVLHLDRLTHVKRFRPLDDQQGGVLPHMVFVNSMSDFWHDAIPESAIQQILDVMEANPSVVFQILTKRPIRARRILTARYSKGIPPHIWIGVSAEDNRVARRLDIMRTIKERTGGGTFFVSVEPIVGPTDALDFTDMDWIITGGESGPKARTMERSWLVAAVENAKRHGIALWHKQSGTVRSHPNIGRVPTLRRPGPNEQFRWLRENGWEALPAEKGGATIDKQTYRELPGAYHELRQAMNTGLL